MAVIWTLLIVLTLAIVIVAFMNDARRERLVREGKATYFVRIAASGKGSVYHSFKCGNNTVCIAVPLAEAQAKGYRPCATCGGRASIRLLDGRNC